MNEIDRACSTYGGKNRCIQGFGGGTLRESDHSEDPGIAGRIILGRISRKWDGGAWTRLIWLRIGQGVHSADSKRHITAVTPQNVTNRLR
jgi:hypothetical protein